MIVYLVFYQAQGLYSNESKTILDGIYFDEKEALMHASALKSQSYDSLSWVEEEIVIGAPRELEDI